MTEPSVVSHVNISTQRARSSASTATACAYVEVKRAEGVTWWGVSMDAPIRDASPEAVLSRVDRTACS